MNIRKLLVVTSLLFYKINYANTGQLFVINATGTPGNVDIILCLNAYGPLSCQRYSVNNLDLNINSSLNHTYHSAGIKVLTPGYTVSGCTPIPNGYCIFNVNKTIPGSISLNKLEYELVTINHPGNSNNSTTNLGSVNYIYKIGKYQVTIAQYTEFLNAIAKTDTYNLYDTNLATNLNSAGIIRNGSPGQYSYSVMSNNGSSANRPITYVNWFSAARFANWMSNGKPSGSQNSTTTENGAYALNGATSGTTLQKNSINPNTGAAPLYYIPNLNEWYKAAFYSPELNNNTGGYYIYATQSNILPGNLIGNTPNQANYFPFPAGNSQGFSTTQTTLYSPFVQNYLTSVGAFTNSPSYFGTYDQNGNALEWVNTDSDSLIALLMGGFWFSGSIVLQNEMIIRAGTTVSYSGNTIRLAGTYTN